MCKMGGFCSIPLIIDVCLLGVLLQVMSFDDASYSANLISDSCMSKIISPDIRGSKDCCIRNSYICTVNGAKDLSARYWVDLNLPVEIRCKYSEINPICNKEACPFYNGKKVSNM